MELNLHFQIEEEAEFRTLHFLPPIKSGPQFHTPILIQEKAPETHEALLVQKKTQFTEYMKTIALKWLQRVLNGR